MNPFQRLCFALGVLFSCCVLMASDAEASWEPVPRPLMTRWSTNVTPENVHPEYPRPRMVRKEWLNLNGLWDYAFTGPYTNCPEKFDGQALVPFPVESALSGVGRLLEYTNRLWYRRSFEIPEGWRDRQVWLRFGALDWRCVVFINGSMVGSHSGGYDAFGFDITPALKPEGPQDIRIFVQDRIGDPGQIFGKQRRFSEDSFYSRISGIWQTVWLEPVAPQHIPRITAIPNVPKGEVEFVIELSGADTNVEIEIEVLADSKLVQSANVRPSIPTTSRPANSRNSPTRLATTTATNTALTAKSIIHLPGARLWSPNDPFLYDARIRLVKEGKVLDEIGTYFGMRQIAMGLDSRGRRQILLNGEPVFQLGILDEGYWPDGLYTAPTDEAMRFDIETIKRFGFNTCRKHVKVEPERWYYWCDKLGMLVWQDMPNGQSGTQDDRPRSKEGAAQFELELERMIKGRFNHPCIVGWVLFNQAWGQFDTLRLTRKVRQLDSARLLISASGWVDHGVGDINSTHVYPSPEKRKPDPLRALFLGEFGGFGVYVSHHSWSTKWSHFDLPDRKLLSREYEKVMRRIAALRESAGLSGAIFTQLTDVEQEVTGLLTYDREVSKIPPETVARINRDVLRSMEKP
jgi:beta-galactosidase/beta-glucuronidase